MRIGDKIKILFYLLIISGFLLSISFATGYFKKSDFEPAECNNGENASNC